MRGLMVKSLIALVLCFSVIIGVKKIINFSGNQSGAGAPRVQNIEDKELSQDSVRKKSPTFGDFIIDANDLYDVYVAWENPNSKEVMLGVIDLKTGEDFKISGTAKFFGSVLVLPDPGRRYILLSSGTYVVRGLYLISLDDKKLMVIGAHGGSEFYYYDDYLLFHGVSHYDNRPWGGGEAYDIVAFNLKEGVSKMLYGSDRLREYNIKSLDGDVLTVQQRYVTNDNDWEQQSKHLTKDFEVDLSEVLN